MAIQKLVESKVYKDIFNRIPSHLRLDANWGWDKNNTVCWPKSDQKIMQEWIDVSDKLRFLRANLVRAANRDEHSKEVKVKLDYLYELGESQNWRCAATGIPLEFVRGGTYWGGKWCNPKSCTIDRIDNDKGYIPGNVRLVTWEANCMRGNIEWDYFVSLCKQVALYNK
jgi:hypothetical protein